MEKLNYFAIMPAKVRYDENLKPMEKLIYSEITVLTNFKGYCYATNSYFAKLYGVHKNSICTWISNLVKYGYLKVEYVLKEIDGEKKQERRIYIVDIKEINQAKKEVVEKILERKVKESKKEDEREVIEKDVEVEEKVGTKKEIEDTNFCEGVSQKTVTVTENIEGPSQKNVRGYQSKLGDPLNEKTEENNTSRIIKENNYYIYTYRGEENLPVVREILKKYSELGLPSYEYPPEKNLVMKAYGELGAKGVFKALEIMSKSNFVMEKMCVDTILKVENLKKALNGNFKADVEEKSVEVVGKKRESIKKSGDEKKFEESEEGKQWKEEQERKISELLEKDVEEEDTPELFSVEELFGKR